MPWSTQRGKDINAGIGQFQSKLRRIQPGKGATGLYHKYRDDLSLLGRLFKMEFIRLCLIPSSPESDSIDSLPTLPFINRIETVVVRSAELQDHRMEVDVTLEWGNGERVTLTVPIWIDDP